MDKMTVFGTVAGFLSVAIAMHFKGIPFSVFVNPAALTIIFMGTCASIMNSFTSNELKNTGKLFKIIFSSGENASHAKIKIINTVVELAMEARKEGLLSLEAKGENLEDPFMRKGIKMLVDGADPDYMLDVLSLEIEAMEERHAMGASIFSSAGAYAPTLGVLGAVFGLIAAMGHIDDTEMMSHAIAAAFIATILGIFTGYVLWNPFASKLKIKSKHEVSEKKMVIEGILSIQKGEPPMMVKDKLMALLSAEEQKMMAAESNDGKDKE